jgi:hypothetical protein
MDATHPFDPASLGLSPGDTAEVTVVRGTTTQTIAVQVGGPVSSPSPASS